MTQAWKNEIKPDALAKLLNAGCELWSSGDGAKPDGTVNSYGDVERKHRVYKNGIWIGYATQETIDVLAQDKALKS